MFGATAFLCRKLVNRERERLNLDPLEEAEEADKEVLLCFSLELGY